MSAPGPGVISSAFVASCITATSSSRAIRAWTTSGEFGSSRRCFAELVGFTKATHDLPPDQVVAYLDELVCAFDALCERCGTDKIKTIGDCYMAVAGIDGDGPGGARAIGRLALAMLETPDRCRLLGGKRLQLRGCIVAMQPPALSATCASLMMCGVML